MAKIGTAQIEIKPVVSDEALEKITQRVADAVAAGVRRGMKSRITLTDADWAYEAQAFRDIYEVAAERLRPKCGCRSNMTCTICAPGSTTTHNANE